MVRKPALSGRASAQGGWIFLHDVHQFLALIGTESGDVDEGLELVGTMPEMIAPPYE